MRAKSRIQPNDGSVPTLYMGQPTGSSGSSGSFGLAVETSGHRPRISMTIRLKLTLWYTALLGITLILFGGVLYSVLATSLWSQVQLNMERQGQEVSRFLSEQLERDMARMNDPRSLELPMAQLFVSSVGVQVVRMDGMVAMRSSNLGSMTIPKSTAVMDEIRQGHSVRYRTISDDGTPLLIYSLPLQVNNLHIVGVVQVIQPVGGVENTLSQVARNLILGIALSLVIAAVVGALLARRALAPLQEITETAQRITRTKDLGQRIILPHGNPTQDKSEVGRLASTFNGMLEQIQQLFNTQRRLTADVSHELRSPLTIIQGNVDLLRRMTGDGSAGPGEAMPSAQANALLQETLGEVEAEANRMAQMISDLLLLAQADSGLQLNPERLEMDTLLLEIYRHTRRVAEQRKGPGALTVRLGSEDQALVWGDRERLRQLLVNLADNAIKYTPAGGEITLGLVVRDNWVRVAVQDTGVGISPEEQKLIFERFYRADKARSREQGGSGLGLSIVQWIADAHGGHITVESEVGKGSTFSVWLPELAADLSPGDVT